MKRFSIILTLVLFAYSFYTGQSYKLSAGEELHVSRLDSFGINTDQINNDLMRLVPEGEENVISEKYGPFAIQERKAFLEDNIRDNYLPSEGIRLPENILVLMVEFPETRFENTITNQDYLADPSYSISDYIGRYMFHLQSYYLDASKELYQINYEVLDSIITLDRSMSYYGSQVNSLARRVRLIRDVIAKVDSVVNFNDFDSYVIFHAGAGKETDVFNDNPNTISSSFINRRLLQAVMAPDDDEFKGIKTEDGTYIQEVIIAASHQNHEITQQETNYSVFGLLTYLFGRQMGLPTLFGNLPQLGAASGVGNFCVMGTGAWNANGHVPPYLSAWIRYVLGWEFPKVITNAYQDLEIVYPFKTPFWEATNRFHINNDDWWGGTPRLYKVPISATEYYLIENREQNPDGAKLGDEPRFSFQLLPEGEQDFYPPPYYMVPRFNFMKNTYRGCDWDFYLPGYGGPEHEVFIDGSGILIWHIDENIINEKYAKNHINADPNHQGVTLIEADGIQHLRSSIPHIYMRGSPYDSFRQGHNDYFGFSIKDDGMVSNPYVKSHYGNTELEIYDISISGPQMTFSVNLPRTIEYDYIGEDVLPLSVVPNSEKMSELIFLPTSSGSVFLLEEDEVIPGYPIKTDDITQLYAYDPLNSAFLVPVEDNDKSRLIIFDMTGKETADIYHGYKWATHPIVLNDASYHDQPGLRFERRNIDDQAYIALALHKDEDAKVVLYDTRLNRIKQFNFSETKIAANMMYKNGILYLITKPVNNPVITNLIAIDTISYEKKEIRLVDEIGASLTNLKDQISNYNIKSALLAPVKRTENVDIGDNLIIITESNGLYLIDLDGSLQSGYPVYFDDDILSVPSLADVTGNGFLDIILVCGHRLHVIDYTGATVNYPVRAELEKKQGEINGDKINHLGAVAFDTNGNGNKEIISIMDANRLNMWDNHLKTVSGYPLVFLEQGKHTPVVAENHDGVFLYVNAENGKIFKRKLPGAVIGENSISSLWYSEYGNLQRTASYTLFLPDNKLKTDAIFVKDQCYVFPTPLTYENGGILYFNIMVSKNTPVELKIFDISGRMIFKDEYYCHAYVDNRDLVFKRIEDLSTGIYIAVLKAKSETMEIRFAVEK